MSGMAQCLPLKRGDLRDALVAYARQQTEQGCINAMSLRAAARDLGVSSGAVYRHFDDKDALLKAVAHEGFMQLRQIFFRIRAEGQVAASAEQAVARTYMIGRAFMQFAQGNPTLWRMMFGRIGVMCRQDHMKDDDLMRYTLLDVARESFRDLYRLGGLPRDPDMSDTRFVWSALHGAADLTQSGARLDGVDPEEVADQTTHRCLLALGCPQALISQGRPPRGTEI